MQYLTHLACWCLLWRESSVDQGSTQPGRLPSTFLPLLPAMIPLPGTSLEPPPIGTPPFWHPVPLAPHHTHAIAPQHTHAIAHPLPPPQGACYSVWCGAKMLTVKPNREELIEELQVMEVQLPEDIERLRAQRKKVRSAAD